MYADHCDKLDTINHFNDKTRERSSHFNSDPLIFQDFLIVSAR
jgi:hypothetical protein